MTKYITMLLIIKNHEDFKNIDFKLLGLKSIKTFNSKKYSGVLKANDSPIRIQNKLREEWN